MSGHGAKKAVHVKWAGKTIALGTFLVAEADEKCARAKALTRAWRSTMRPKPTREWVMLELERLNVRVVAGRSGVKDEEFQGDEGGSGREGPVNPNANCLNGAGPNLVGRRGSITASLLNAADMARGEWGGAGGVPPVLGVSNILQRRNSSLSTSLLGDAKFAGGMGSADGVRLNNKNDGDDSGPSHRPFVGGGSAAAYEVARAEHYRELAEKKKKGQGKKDSGGGNGNNNNNNNNNSNSMSNDRSSQGLTSNGMTNALTAIGGGAPNFNGSGGLNGGFGGANAGSVGAMGQGLGGLSINANRHYEMLKLHHMNLLNEIQETTLMMNIYQQQQLQQQQQQQQQQFQNEQYGGGANSGNYNSQMPMIGHQQNANRNSMGGTGNGSSNGNVKMGQQFGGTSNGMNSPGSNGGNSTSNQHERMNRNSLPSKDASNDGVNSDGASGGESSMVDSVPDSNREGNKTTSSAAEEAKTESREDRLAKIKAEIEERKRMLEELVNNGGGKERTEPNSKRVKTAV